MTTQSQVPISKEFLVELCKYYMEFLETDFKSQRPPSRRVYGFSTSAKQSDVRLDKYPRLNAHALKHLLGKFQSNNLKTIKQNVYTINLAEKIISFLEADDKISQIEDFRDAKDELLAFISKKKFSEKADILSDIEGFINLKIESGDSPLTLKDLEEFIKKRVSSDFYHDVYNLWKLKQTTENKDLYLYFYSIKMEEHTFPIFYIPLSINFEQITATFTLDFDPVLLINKKSIQYATTKFAREENMNRRIDLPFQRQIYYHPEENLKDTVQSILNEITSFFGLDLLDINKTGESKVSGASVTIDNSCFLALFDKSDEAIVNDYEELINLAEKGEVFSILEKLANSFFFDNPRTYEREVESAYDEQTVSERLSYASPIPLNREQSQIINAIKKDGCNQTIIEGPPGSL